MTWEHLLQSFDWNVNICYCCHSNTVLGRGINTNLLQCNWKIWLMFWNVAKVRWKLYVVLLKRRVKKSKIVFEGMHYFNQRDNGLHFHAFTATVPMYTFWIKDVTTDNYIHKIKDLKGEEKQMLSIMVFKSLIQLHFCHFILANLT